LIPYNELKERIAQRLNPDEIVELLNISTKELLEEFGYKIEEHYEELIKEFDDEEDSEESENRD
jgi:translation initiation factor 2 alpha subunit (eIF-2alpha)